MTALCWMGGMSLALALQPADLSETDVEESPVSAPPAAVVDLSSDAIEQPDASQPAEDGVLDEGESNGSEGQGGRSRSRSSPPRPNVRRESGTGQAPGQAGNRRQREPSSQSAPPRSNRRPPGPGPDGSRASANPAGPRDRGGSPASASPGFGRFKLILDRNIFNTTRSAAESRRPRSENRPRAESTFSLVGTLSSEKGQFAFFEGSSSEYRKVLHPGQKIATYKIAEVTGNQVKLDSGTNTIELQVGMQMRLSEGGWKTVGGPTVSSPEKSPSAAASVESAGTDESDIIKRLMEQREKELR